MNGSVCLFVHLTVSPSVRHTILTMFPSSYDHEIFRSYYQWLGLKRYAQPTIRYDTQYAAHDAIRSTIHLPFLPGKQRLVITACDQKHCTPPTTTACAVMMHSGYNNGGLLGVSRCSVFVMNWLILLEYTDCFLWYLVFVSNFGMCYICTVSYGIVLRAYRDTYRSLCIGDIPVCRCIVSALPMTEMMSVQKGKVIGQRSRSQRSWPNLAVPGL